MKITYTKLSEPKPTNCFEVIFSYEHGDADSSSSNTISLEGVDETFLLEYVKKAEEIAHMIDRNRSYGSDLPKYFSESELLNIGDYYIPVERDDYAKMNMSNYYAGMGIENIFYYDANGEKFLVTLQK